MDDRLAPPSARRQSSRLPAVSVAIAAVGLAAALVAPAAYRNATFPSLAQAAHADIGSQESLGFADVVAKVEPAVISVRAKMDQGTSLGPDGRGRNSPFPPGSPMDNFFPKFGPRNHRAAIEQGSGFFISADGYAVTNNHVVDNVKSVEITADDGKVYPAKIAGTDPKTDLALIKVAGRNDFPFVTFGDKAPQVGDWVVAVGNPFGLGETVIAGIVSAEHRNIGEGPYDDFLQIDAPINAGNSGGPSFDLDGNVVGVNTAIVAASGGSVGIGFAIPAKTAKTVVAQLKSSGHVTRAWLGVAIQDITPDIADGLHLNQGEGTLIAEAKPKSPAAKAGLRSGDVVTAVNGGAIKTASELAHTIAELVPGSVANIDILRDGSPKTVAVTLGTMPNDSQMARILPRWGFTR